MKHFYNRPGRLAGAKRLALSILLGVGAMGAAQAQFYAAANVTNTAGTYTDLGTTGTAIATANTDDANSAATPIGFTFTYNGTAFTNFVLNTNGFVKLGTVAPAGPMYSDGGQSSINGPLDGPDTNLLLPFNQDLGPGSAGGTEYRVLTTGTAPNRVCTIQWKNVADKPRTTFGTQYANFSFQAKLYETSNQLDFVYGLATAGAPGADVAKFCIVGVKGSSATALVLGTKASATPWSGTTFLAGPYPGNAHNVRGTVLPDPGRTYRFAAPVPNDAAVLVVHALTQLPIPQGAPHVVRAVVSNVGTTALANLPVTLTVTGANAFTNTQTVAALAVGASASVSFAPFTPTATGTNTLTVTVPPDGDNTNNSRGAAQVVNTTTYSYADPRGADNSFIAGPFATTRGYACRYSVSSPAAVTEVRPYVVNFGGPATNPGSVIGKTVYGVVLNAATGALLARSADHVITAAEINTYVPLPLTTLVSLPAGTAVLVGMAQEYLRGQTTAYAAIGVQLDGPGRAGAFYLVSTSSAFPPDDTGSTGFKLMIEAVTAPATLCPPPTNLAATNITPTGATLTFTPPAGASGYSLTYAVNGGPATTVTPAPTGSPVVLTGLTPATTYTLALTTSCGGGQVSLPTTFDVTTALTGPIQYATLPVLEDFEGPWRSIGGVRNAPTLSWRSTPPTGVQSWRRDDDGASAGWQTNLAGFGGSTGLHSARFHTEEAPAGSTGSLDLYVNMGTPGPKTLTFDSANDDGTDVIDVLVSTDGGATFNPTPVLTVGASLTVLFNSVAIASTSATTVIRFRATSDHGLGDPDMAIDNLRIAVVLATRNEALAAAVGLFPNPAHSAFALAVPAGALHAASATLHNALGQVVQVRQLALPAAGGTAEFDVRGLAAGVYSLMLQAGNDVVVKRVVVE